MNGAAAVHATPSGMLLAAADDGGVTLLVALPDGTAPGEAVAGYLGDVPPAVVVLVGETAAGPVPFPGEPRVLPVPFAAAVLATGPAAPPGPVLVLDADPAGLRGWLVCGAVVTPVPGPLVPGPLPPGPAPLAPSSSGRFPPVPGAGSTADRWAGVARWSSGAVRGSGCREVVLAGEHAGTPGLAAAVEAAVPCPVRPAGPLSDDDPAAVDGAGPATAAVLGAALLGAGLRLVKPQSAGPPITESPSTGRSTAGPPTMEPPSVVAPPTRTTDPAAPAAAAAGPGPPRRRRSVPGVVLPGVALLGAALVVAGLLGGRTVPAAVPGAPAVVQYGYAATLPDGWEHTGGNPARMRTLLTPAGRPDGADLIVLERSPLGYDAGREPVRAARELAALLAGEPGVTGPEPRAVGGRELFGYTQRDAGTVTDWHVLLDGTDQLLAGCRRPAAEPGPGPACVTVVASLRRAP
ncbi:type VII secretion-associated protein [Pseudonocardia nantongensis]|uniref:type VII secretion-associated protein n=1 Tax=Pseudonocardia nantongensis TaxID=1181885 RepID=UPI00397A02FC